MHYRTAPYSMGSGQFRTACGEVLSYRMSTLDRSQVTCPDCRTSQIFRDNQEVFGDPSEDPTAEELLAAIRRSEANADLHAAYLRAFDAIKGSDVARKLSAREMRFLLRTIVQAVLQKQPIQ